MRIIQTLTLVAGLALTLCSAGLAQEQNEATQAAAASAAELRDRAVQQVLRSARSDDPYLRANALEAAAQLPERLVPLVQLGLEDSEPVVRFAALVVAGREKLGDLAPAARPLLSDESPSVRAAAMYMLRRVGQDVDITPMATMFAGQSTQVRGNVAMLLGLLGDRSALPMLTELAKIPMPRASALSEAVVRVQVAEAAARLGDDESLDAIRAGAYSQFDEVRVLAVQIMGRVGDARMAPALEALLEDPPIELQLAAAESLARLGQGQGLGVLLKGAGHELATARSQAALALGLFKGGRSRAALARLLEDANEQVRLAAAAGMLRQAEARLSGA